MRMLDYGIAVDCVDDYLHIGASTTLECMKKFILGVIEVFGKEYLRKPNQVNVDHLLQVAEARDFLLYIRKHWLHALEVKELSSGLEVIISKETL